MKLIKLCICIQGSKYFCFLKLMKKAFTSSYQVMRPNPFSLGEAKYCMFSLLFSLTWAHDINTEYRSKKSDSKSYLPKCSLSSPNKNPWDRPQIHEIHWERGNNRGPACSIGEGGIFTQRGGWWVKKEKFNLQPHHSHNLYTYTGVLDSSESACRFSLLIAWRFHVLKIPGNSLS